MADNESGDGYVEGHGISSDLDSELRAWEECRIAIRVADSSVGEAVGRMRVATSEDERDRLRTDIRGFFRRLSLGMLALAVPGDRVTIAKGP